MKTTTLFFTIFDNNDNYLEGPNKKKFLVERSTEFVNAVEELTRCSRDEAIRLTKTVAEELEFHLNNVTTSKEILVNLITSKLNHPSTKEETLVDILNMMALDTKV